MLARQYEEFVCHNTTTVGQEEIFRMYQNMLKRCNTIIHCVLVMVCLGHICSLWYFTLHPELPDIRVSHR